MSRTQNRRIDSFDLSPSPATNLYFGIALIVVVLLILSLLVIDRLFQPVLFQVDKVRYHGYFERVSPEELDAAVLPVVSGNILSVDLDAVRRAVESLPWVSRATITKEWPSTIEVSVDEHRPAARWAAGGCVSSRGVRIPGDIALLPESMPLLAGPDDQASEVLNRYQAWGTVLAGVGLSIESLKLSTRGAWRARLRVNDASIRRPAMVADGQRTDSPSARIAGVQFELLIGRNDANERVARFSRIYRRALQPRVAWVERVDLRHTNGFAVKWINSNSADEERDRNTDQSNSAGAVIGRIDPIDDSATVSQRV